MRARENAVRYGADAGVATVWRAHRMLELAGGEGVPLLLTVNGPVAHTLLIAEAWFEPPFGTDSRAALRARNSS